MVVLEDDSEPEAKVDATATLFAKTPPSIASRKRKQMLIAQLREHSGKMKTEPVDE